MGKKRYFFLIGLAFSLVLSGCGSQNETEALQRQIAQLEQKVSELEAQNLPSFPGEQSEMASQGAASDSSADGLSSGGSSDTQAASVLDSGPVSGGQTTDTMEALAAVVSAFEEKVDAIPPDGGAEGLELFFALKQEEKQIGDRLDLHEDELEFQYRAGSLAKGGYEALERELEQLEDRLDAAEDQLEHVFGMDD